MNRRRDFSEKCTDLKQPYCFIKVYWSVKFHEIEKDTIVLFVIKLTKTFSVPKACTR